MPTSVDILRTLAYITNSYTLYAIFWHIIFFTLIIALIFFRWKPGNNLMSVLLSLPLFSVSIFSWLAGNPFNGIVFIVLTLLFLYFGSRTSREHIETSTIPFIITGSFLITFGLIYPHFLETNFFLKYFYAAPAGLIPCPTLCIILGFLMIYNGFKSRALVFIIIAAGLFYGIFGFFKLKVYMDIALLLGTLIFIFQYIFEARNSLKTHNTV